MSKKLFGRLVCGLAMVSAVAALLAPVKVSAQSGFDVYGNLRTLIVDPPRTISGGAANSTTNTTPVDLHLFTGRVIVDVFSKTNTGNSGTMAVNFQTSPDLATWTPLANYSMGQSASVIYSNFYYGTNGLTATNSYNLPGLITTPSAATAGFATPYLNNAAPFTNSGAFTVTTDGVYTVGFQVDDVGRYLRVYYTPGGNATNSSLGAILTGRIAGGPGGP